MSKTANLRSNAKGETESRNVGTVITHKPANIGPWILAGLVFIGLIVGAVLFTNGNDDVPPQQATPVVQPQPSYATPAPSYSEPAPKPTTTRPERNNNENDADHGSVNINGDQNNVIIDNSVSHNHDHTTRRVVEEYIITPGIKRSKVNRSIVPQECDDEMVKHHQTLARWYAEK